MKLKSLILLSLQLLLLQQIAAQVVQLRFDEELIKPRTVYEYYPHFYQVQVLQGEKHYSIVKGTASVVRKGKKITTQSIAGKEAVFRFKDKQLLPGSRLVIEVQEIADPATNQTIKTNYVAAVLFKDTLTSKQHPHYQLLVNTTSDYLKQGVNPASVETVKFVFREDYSPGSITIYHVRGLVAMREQKFADVAQATLGLKEMMKDAAVRTGDRMVVEFIGKKPAVFQLQVAF